MCKEETGSLKHVLILLLLMLVASISESTVMPVDKAKFLQNRGYSTDTPEQLINATKSEGYVVRYMALDLLTARIGKDAIPFLKKSLNDPKIYVRCTAAHLLGTLGDKSGVVQMKQDLEELAPNNGKFLPPDPNLPEEESERRITKWNYGLVDALQAAKVLAELGDYSGYELATRMVIEGSLPDQKWRAISALVEMAKADESLLYSKSVDPVFVLKAVAETEKQEGAFYVLINLCQKELKYNNAIEILEVARNSRNQPEENRRIAQTYINDVKERQKASKE